MTDSPLSRPLVVVTISDESGAFPGDILAANPALAEIDIVLLVAESCSLRQLPTPSVPVETFTATANGHELHARYRKLIEGRSRTCLMVHTSSDHEQAIKALRQAGSPVYVWRNWTEDDIALAVQKKDLQELDKHTDVNAYPTFELREAQETAGIRLHNPFVMEQPELGDDSLRLMLEHGLLSLFFGNRNHPVSGHCTDDSHLQLAVIANFYCNQDSVDSVTSLVDRYSRYAGDLLDRVHFVIVDDGSPLNYDIPDYDLNLTWLKINEDIPWNHAGARNLGAVYARAHKLVMSDLDHYFPEKTLDLLLKFKQPGRTIYKFKRYDENNGKSMRGHPNTFFLARSLFLRNFGYDEELAGHYGAEDVRFIKFMKGQGARHWHLPDKYLCHKRKAGELEGSYHSLRRDHSVNTPVDARKKKEMQWYGREHGYSRMNLNFTWQVLRDTRRSTRPAPIRNKWWKRTYLLRQLLPMRF